MHTLGVVIALVLQLYMFLLVARMIISLVGMLVPGFSPRGPLLVICEGIYTLTDPPIKMFSRIIPDVRAGGVSISLSFIATWVLVMVLQQLDAALLLR